MARFGSSWWNGRNIGTVRRHRRKLPIETAGLYEELVGLFGPRVPGPEGFVLAGTMTDRIEGCNRRINTFVRRFMKGTQKGAYNLRKQFGSEMIAKPEIGLELGSALLGHAQVSTTQDHYYDQLKLGKMRPLG
jgi:integrase